MKKNIIKIAKEVVQTETISLKKLEANIGKSFEQIIKTIINTIKSATGIFFKIGMHLIFVFGF